MLQKYEATKAALVEAGQLTLIADGCRGFVQCWKDMVQVDVTRTQNPSRTQAITVCATQDLITKAQYGASRPASQHYAIDVRVVSILTRLFHSAPRGKTVHNPSLAGLFRAYTVGFASARDGDGSAPSRCIMTELQSAMWHCIVLCSINGLLGDDLKGWVSCMYGDGSSMRCEEHPGELRTVANGGIKLGSSEGTIGAIETERRLAVVRFAQLFQSGPISGHLLILGKFRSNVLEERRTEGRSEPAIVLLPDGFNVHELSLSESARLTDWDAQPHLRQIYDTFTAYGTHDGATEHARMTTVISVFRTAALGKSEVFKGLEPIVVCMQSGECAGNARYLSYVLDLCSDDPFRVRLERALPKRVESLHVMPVELDGDVRGSHWIPSCVPDRSDAPRAMCLREGCGYVWVPKASRKRKQGEPPQRCQQCRDARVALLEDEA